MIPQGLGLLFVDISLYGGTHRRRRLAVLVEHLMSDCFRPAHARFAPLDLRGDVFAVDRVVVGHVATAAWAFAIPRCNIQLKCLAQRVDVDWSPGARVYDQLADVLVRQACLLKISRC